MLVLSQSYEPISICSARKAILLVFLLKAEVIAEREGLTFRSVRASFPYPSIIRLSSYIRIPYKNVDLSRKNILRRDGHRCQYCGTTTQPLTIDHIMPRSRHGEDTWENLTTACIRCNNKKGNRTPDEAGMRLLSVPKRPHHIIFLKQFMATMDSSWKPYLFLE